MVDPGFSKQKIYNPRVRVESLLVSPISKARYALLPPSLPSFPSHFLSLNEHLSLTHLSLPPSLPISTAHNNAAVVPVELALGNASVCTPREVFRKTCKSRRTPRF